MILPPNHPLESSVSLLLLCPRVTIHPPIGLGIRDVLTVAMYQSDEPWVIISPKVLHRDWANRLGAAFDCGRVYVMTEQLVLSEVRERDSIDIRIPPWLWSPDVNVLLDCCRYSNSPGRGPMHQAVHVFISNRRRVWIRQ